MTTPAFPTLSIAPFEYTAMDYAWLREEGLRQLGRLTGGQWTDFNAHDPGITILEQLCYALTDLGYRIAHPMADLLAGSEGALPGPAAILTCDPVTHADLRKLVLDVEGIETVWIEPPAEPEVAVYHHRGSGELRLQPDPSAVDARALRLDGVYQVSLQTGDRLPSGVALAQVNSRLHAQRRLGEDLVPALLGSSEVWVSAKIEIGPTEDPAAVLAEITEKIESHLAPRVRFTSLTDARAEGARFDELFDGPALQRGFVVDALPDARRVIRASDLLHAIMDVPAVRAVRSLVLSTSSSGPREQWQLAIAPGQVAVLATDSELTLLRAGLPVRVDPAEVLSRLAQRRLVTAANTEPLADDRGAQPPPGRDRGLARYRSIQHQFPAVYGIGPLGLPARASGLRKAQARQLEAYLLLFDQLLANAFAQLAHARELLSPTEQPTRTYFAQPVEDPRLRIAGLLRQDPATYRAWLDVAVERVGPGGDSLARRKRFLTHLLARYAEQVGDYAQIGDADEALGLGWALIEDRQAFLRQYPRLGRARGSGYDIHDPASEVSGLEQRLRLQLGLREHPRFHLVEHVLLRPIAEDARQIGEEGFPQVPLLAGVAEPDPWSLQVSFVFEARKNGEPDNAFEQKVGEAILADTPAHLRPHLYWFGGGGGEDHWSAFESAWAAFRAAYRDYRTARLSATLVPDELHLRVRAARDRVIDLLGFGRTYPLRDLPLPRLLMVAPGEPAAIRIEMSQLGVIYGLRDRTTGAAILLAGKPIEVAGTGGPIDLPTPKVTEDVGYRILAVKAEGRDDAVLRREAWLHGVVSIEKGVDVTLTAQITGLPRLDSKIDAPQPADARLADFGAEVVVEILASQEGVAYELIDAADNTRVVSQKSVVGTGGTITLKTKPVAEDLDLRIRGTRTGGDPKDAALRSGLLTIVLALRVRADTSLAVTLVPGAIVAYGGTATLRVATTQKSAEYRVYRRATRDREFVFVDPAPVPVITVLDGARKIRVQRPDQPAVWEQLEPLGEARVGNGATLEFPLGAFAKDSLLFVQAKKHHRKSAKSAELIDSAVQLAQVQALFVQPDPQRQVRIQATLVGAASTGPLQVTGGQPGVYYDMRVVGKPNPIGLSAYFHQRDDVDDRFNKGIEQLVIEVDLAIARTSDNTVDLDKTAPLPVVVDVDPPLASGTVLQIQARKAMSGLVVDLAGTATLHPIPALKVEPAVVSPGGVAKVVIDASLATERYVLLAGDTVVREAVGVGGKLELATAPLNATTTLVLAVERSGPAALPVERRTAIVVKVQ